MDNITHSAKKNKNNTIIPVVDKPISNIEVSELIEKCEELIKSSNELYLATINKHLSDAMISFYLAKESLELVTKN